MRVDMMSTIHMWSL